MGNLPIYNCHIHTFTMKHVPNHFLKLVSGPVIGIPLNKALRWKPFAKFFVKVAPYIGPFSDNDLIERQARFIETGFQETGHRIENIGVFRRWKRHIIVHLVFSWLFPQLLIQLPYPLGLPLMITAQPVISDVGTIVRPFIYYLG